MDFKIFVLSAGGQRRSGKQWRYEAYSSIAQIGIHRDLDGPFCDTQEEARKMGEEDLKELGQPEQSGQLCVDQFMNCWYWICYVGDMVISKTAGYWYNTNEEALEAGVAGCECLDIQIKEIVNADIH